MQTAPIGEGARLARLGSFVPGLPERIPVNLTFLMALACCGLVYVFLWKTTWGYELRATGQNPAAAEYGGISIRKQMILAMVISGALAGMVGVHEVLGYRYRYYDGFSANYGFTGIAVALLGRNHPAGVLVAALLFAVIQRGAVPVDAFTRHISNDIVQILQALVILCVAAESAFRGPLRAIFRSAGPAESTAAEWPISSPSRCGFRPSPSRRRWCGRRLAACSRSAPGSSTSRSRD
jgi:simple sugar transport system permease protein